MDWGQLLVLFILLGLPLLEFFERILKQRRHKGVPPPPPPDPGLAAPRRRQRPVEEGVILGGPGSEGGATDWSASLPEMDTSRDGAQVETLDAEWQAGTTMDEYVPEADRPASTVVSLEPLNVDRAAEHDRFHRATDQSATPSMRRAPPRLAARLRNREDLRNAIVLAEVLGPPRSQR